jgi:uncharacterized iron-regulated membrane protein
MTNAAPRTKTIWRFLKPRAWIQFVHLWTSLLLGVFMLLMIVTGSLLMFRPELEPLVYRDLYRVTALPTGGSPVSLEVALKAVTKASPGYFVDSLELPAMTHGPIRIRVTQFGDKPDGMVFVDPNSGKVNGFQAEDSSIFDWLVLLHKRLLVKYSEGNDWGHWLAGLIGLVWVLMLLTGLVLWIPKLNQWKHAFALRRKNAYIWNHDVHKLIGLLVLVPLIVIISVILPRTVGGSFLDTTSYPKALDPKFVYPTEKGAPTNLDGLLRKAEAFEAGARAVYVKPGPTTTVKLSSLRDAGRDSGHYQGDIELTLDANSGHIMQITDTRTWNPLAVAVHYNHYVSVHAGTWGGWITRLLEFLVTLGTLYLAWTGVRQWWIKRGLRRKSKRAKTITT